MSILNDSNTDKFEVVFSNIPIPTTRTDAVDLAVFNNYVKLVTLPDYNIELLPSEFAGETIRTPVSRQNNDLAPITIDFQADEDLENYITFFDWMKAIRCGTPLKGETNLKDSTIKAITVVMNDNQDRAVCKITLKDVIIVGLSSLNMVFGSSEHTNFTITLQYSDWNIERVDTIRNN